MFSNLKNNSGDNILRNINSPCNSNLVVLDKILFDKLIDIESVSLILRYDFPNISAYFSRISNKSFHNLFSRQMFIETFVSVFSKKKIVYYFLLCQAHVNGMKINTRMVLSKKKKKAGLFPKQIFRHLSNIIFRLQSFIGSVRQSEAKSQ